MASLGLVSYATSDEDEDRDEGDEKIGEAASAQNAQNLSRRTRFQYSNPKEKSSDESILPGTPDITKLPSGWQAVLEKSSNRYYYWCEATGQTTWTFPGIESHSKAQVVRPFKSQSTTISQDPVITAPTARPPAQLNSSKGDEDSSTKSDASPTEAAKPKKTSSLYVKLSVEEVKKKPKGATEDDDQSSTLVADGNALKEEIEALLSQVQEKLDVETKKTNDATEQDADKKADLQSADESLLENFLRDQRLILKTRKEDWENGGLSDSYFKERLEDTQKHLREEIEKHRVEGSKEESADASDENASSHASRVVTLSDGMEIAESVVRALELPPDWRQLWDEESKRHYYYNVKTDEVRLSPPASQLATESISKKPLQGKILAPSQIPKGTDFKSLLVYFTDADAEVLKFMHDTMGSCGKSALRILGDSYYMISFESDASAIQAIHRFNAGEVSLLQSQETAKSQWTGGLYGIFIRYVNKSDPRELYNVEAYKVTVSTESEEEEDTTTSLEMLLSSAKTIVAAPVLTDTAEEDVIVTDADVIAVAKPTVDLPSLYLKRIQDAQIAAMERDESVETAFPKYEETWVTKENAKPIQGNFVRKARAGALINKWKSVQREGEAFTSVDDRKEKWEEWAMQSNTTRNNPNFMPLGKRKSEDARPSSTQAEAGIDSHSLGSVKEGRSRDSGFGREQSLETSQLSKPWPSAASATSGRSWRERLASRQRSKK